MTESAEILRQAVFDQVSECRRSVEEGQANLAGLEDSVREYCLSVASLEPDARRDHEADLQALMKEIETLGESLKQARDAVLEELGGLSRMKQANVAYHTTDSIGTKRIPKPEEE